MQGPGDDQPSDENGLNMKKPGPVGALASAIGRLDQGATGHDPPVQVIRPSRSGEMGVLATM